MLGSPVGPTGSASLCRSILRAFIRKGRVLAHPDRATNTEAATDAATGEREERMTPRDRSRWSLLAVFVALALVISACQGQPGGGPTTSAAPAAAGDQADPNGELVTNMGSEPDTIDPQKESFVNEIGVT